MVHAVATVFLLQLALVSGSFGRHHGCPFLTKVVPQGKPYTDFASELLRLRDSDCAAFAEKFMERANVTMLGNSFAASQAQMEQFCKKTPSEGTPKTVFPAFSTSEMLVQIEDSQGESTLARIHVCSKSQKITAMTLLKSSPPDMFETYRRIGDTFAKEVFEKYNCDFYSSSVESNAVVNFNGNPSLLTRGRTSSFDNAKSAQEVCQANANKEKRFHTSNSIKIAKYYWNPAQLHLTLIVERSTSVVFSPGVVRTNPIAVVLQFSSVGPHKVKAIQLFEIEALHIEKKYGAAYASPSAPSKKHAASKPQSTKEDATKKDEPELVKDDDLNTWEHAVHGPPGLLLELSGVSGATSAMAASRFAFFLAFLGLALVNMVGA